MKSDHVNVLAMIKGEERYIFLYNEQNRIEMLRTLGRYAADPELNFSWYDAAIMSKKIRELAYEDQNLESELISGDHSAGNHSAGNLLKPPQSRFSFRHEQDMID